MPTSPSRRRGCLLITMGDPSGIGPEVLLSALAQGKGTLLEASPFSITVIGDLRWLKKLSSQLCLVIPWDRIQGIDVQNLPSRFSRGKVQPLAGWAAFEYLGVAAAQLKKNPIQALVTAPVSKEAIVRAGIPWIGHTEYLGRAFNVKPLMMFVTGSFRASLVTTHLSIRKVPASLTREKVARALKMTREALIHDFGIPQPRIGLAALNPHAGEGTLLGREEQSILRPAVRAAGGSVRGPIPADSLLRAAAAGEYDVVVALYHDQALIAVKLVGWERAVNVTLGLPFIRTSPVHGTAFDLVGKGKADPSSMRAAIDLAMALSRRRHAR